jgi:hypothetical protein
MRLIAAVEERPHRRTHDLHRAFPGEAFDHFVEDDVPLLFNEAQNEVRMGVKLEAARLSLLVRLDASRCPFAPRSIARRRLAHRKALGGLAGRQAAFNRGNHAFP